MADPKAPPKKPSALPSVTAPATAEIVVAVILILAIIPLVSEFFFPAANSGEVSGFVVTAVSYIKMTSTIISMIALLIVVYSFLRIHEISVEEKKKLGLVLNWHTEKTQKNARWEKVEQYMTSLNSSDWKIAILEADNILDEIVERMGYDGPTLGERMKKIEASDFPYLDEAWQAHKLRNSIAHKGTDYPLTRSEADQAINTYHRVFRELGYLS